jgi:competence ComEA-like helix-hairpin-helix protein
MIAFLAGNIMPELKGIQIAGFNIAAVIACILSFCFMFSSGTANSTQAAIELQNKINPNDAPAASLARLPGVGIIKANGIVEYRSRFIKTGRGDKAFRNCSDLDNVKGIGPKTAENMCESLRFD